MINEKKVAKSGIVGIPVAIRRQLNIQGGDVLDVTARNDGSIVLKPHNPRCVICSNTENVTMFNGKGICKECAKKALEVMTDE